MTAAIEAQNIVLSFGETPALRGASLSAAPGFLLTGASSRPRTVPWTMA